MAVTHISSGKFKLQKTSIAITDLSEINSYGYSDDITTTYQSNTNEYFKYSVPHTEDVWNEILDISSCYSGVVAVKPGTKPDFTTRLSAIQPDGLYNKFKISKLNNAISLSKYDESISQYVFVQNIATTSNTKDHLIPTRLIFNIQGAGGGSGLSNSTSKPSAGAGSGSFASIVVDLDYFPEVELDLGYGGIGGRSSDPDGQEGDRSTVRGLHNNEWVDLAWIPGGGGSRANEPGYLGKGWGGILPTVRTSIVGHVWALNRESGASGGYYEGGPGVPAYSFFCVTSATLAENSSSPTSKKTVNNLGGNTPASSHCGGGGASHYAAGPDGWVQGASRPDGNKGSGAGGVCTTSYGANGGSSFVEIYY